MGLGVGRGATHYMHRRGATEPEQMVRASDVSVCWNVMPIYFAEKGGSYPGSGRGGTARAISGARAAAGAGTRCGRETATALQSRTRSAGTP